MSIEVLEKSVILTGVRSCRHISHVTSGLVWISDEYNNLILTNTSGEILYRLSRKISDGWGVHTANSDRDLLYINKEYNICKLCTRNDTKTLFIKSTASWKPSCIYSSPSSGDLLVGIIHAGTGKVVRYNSTGKLTQTIECDNTGQGLYSLPNYITENRNRDVIVSDLYSVVVVDSEGKYRFSYIGHQCEKHWFSYREPSLKLLLPCGICTDAVLHILISDWNTNTVQIIDKNGIFLSVLMTQQEDFSPQSLSYDAKTNLLWVGSGDNNRVNIYKNIYTNSLADILQNSICNRHCAQLARWFCLECDVDMCFICFKSKIHKGHFITTLQGEVAQMEENKRIFSFDDFQGRTKGLGVQPLPSDPSMHELEHTERRSIKERSDIEISSSKVFKELLLLSDSSMHTLEQEEFERRCLYMYTRKRSEIEKNKAEIEEVKISLLSDDFQGPTKGLGVQPLPSDSSMHKLEHTETRSIKKRLDIEINRRDFLLSALSFQCKLRQMKDNGEDEIRIQRLIYSLNIETTHHQSYKDGRKITDYEDIIRRVDYLDCSGLYFSNVEKKNKSFKRYSQSSVADFQKWIMNCDKIFQKTKSTKCKFILFILFSRYTKEALFGINLRKHPSLLYNCLHYAFKNENHVLLLELVRLYIFEFDFQLQIHFKDIKTKYVAMDTLLQIAKFMVLRKCPCLRQRAIRLSFCCEDGPKKKLVMIMLYNGNIENKDGIPEKAMGLKLVLYNFSHPSDEASSFFKSFAGSSSTNALPVVTEKDARKLFKEHSNLTLISASHFKSEGYLKGKHIVIEKPCISLLCLHKGYIPFGEREFPKQFHGFDVDVQEGYCFLGSGRSIDFGGHIRRARGINTPGNGSIGGFVDLSDGSVGLITCAHVVFSSDELKIPNSELEQYVHNKGSDLNIEVFDKNQHKFQVCGYIKNKRFPFSSNNNSVDAALIQLDETVNKFQFPVILADQLDSAGFDPNKPPIFTGEVVRVPDPNSSLAESRRLPDRLDSVIKYGSKTKFTIGSLYSDGVHIRFISDTGELPDTTPAYMFNQIEIRSLPHGPFFEPGDSGAFVFCINPDKSLSCLGMAIGSNTKGSCLVTPMDRILDSFRLPHRLKPCPPIVSGNNPRAPENPVIAMQSSVMSEVNLGTILMELKNMQTTMTSMQTSLTDRMTNIQTSLSERMTNMETSITSMQTSITDLQIQQRDIRSSVQTEIGNLKTEVQEIKDENETRSSESSSDYMQK